ncbi:hypothetical protein F442_20535 [Phytophthora nicotianae P10297]|uniref:Uncharacterized protein n=1 Tax=Phytophthora nicotianae P10297 TaxID=1317064 RepID=W2Y669_PHYNI|nr:hypothetical protein F442_20535 [Phytophthora nicotianae P10297]
MQLKMPVIQQLPLLERWKSTIRFLPDGFELVGQTKTTAVPDKGSFMLLLSSSYGYHGWKTVGLTLEYTHSPNSTLSNAVHQIPGRRGKATTFATTAPAERIYG